MIKLLDDRRRVGGVALGGVWIGCSADENQGDLDKPDIGAILNVAQDYDSTRGWKHGFESMRVGLVDGPGNELCAYIAAVLALHALCKRHNALVCCHTGSRSLAVTLMYVQALTAAPWDRALQAFTEKVDDELPAVKDVHREAAVRVAKYFDQFAVELVCRK